MKRGPEVLHKEAAGGVAASSAALHTCSPRSSPEEIFSISPGPAAVHAAQLEPLAMLSR